MQCSKKKKKKRKTAHQQCFPSSSPPLWRKAASFTTGPISWFTASRAFPRVLYAKRSIVGNGNQEQSVTAGVGFILHTETADCSPSSVARFISPVVLHRRRIAWIEIVGGCGRKGKIILSLAHLLIWYINITCTLCLISYHDSAASCCSRHLKLAKRKQALSLSCTRL